MIHTYVIYRVTQVCCTMYQKICVCTYLRIMHSIYFNATNLVTTPALLFTEKIITNFMNIETFV